IADHFINMQKMKLQLAGDLEEILTLINQTCIEFGVQGYKIEVKPHANGTGGCHCFWERSFNDQREFLDYLRKEVTSVDFKQFSDKVELEGGKGEAFWIFEPHDEVEEL